MFGFTLGLKGIVIAAAVSAVVAFGAGWKTRDWQCDAAEQKTRADAAEAREKNLLKTIERQKSDISTLNTLRAQDAQRAAEREKADREIQENINATPPSNNKCIDRAARDRINRVR